MPETWHLPDIAPWSFRSLTADDRPTIQALLKRAGDYVEIVEGRSFGPDADAEFLAAAPPGWSPEAVLKLGVADVDGRLIGVLEAVEDYPGRGQAHIGLLVLEPDARGRGGGERVYLAFERWVRGRGSRRVVLSVVDDNTGALRFWPRLGFRPTRILPPALMGAKTQGRTEFAKEL